jgi:hypothetical protein
MSVIGPCYTGETPLQISTRETFNLQTQSDIGIRNLLMVSHGNSTVSALVATAILAARTNGYVTEISPSTVIDTSGNVTNKHK